MIRTAITVCLVPEARQGPFVLHCPLEEGVARAAAHGFDAVEVFPREPAAVQPERLRGWLGEKGLRLAAVGTGAGFVVHKLTLIDPDAGARAKAVAFVKAIVDVAGALGAPAIIGSMQGRHAEGEREGALGRLAESLAVLGEYAKQYGVPLLYEPLNRYETNLFNRQGEAAACVRERGIGNVKILCDLFHMNIEEADLGAALRAVGADLLGHIHFVDSNRRAAGLGHMDYGPVVSALRDLSYTGYLSAEALPLPDPETAARETVATIRRLFGESQGDNGTRRPVGDQQVTTDH